MATCIFCPNEANSNEDLFPNWVLARVNTRYQLRRQVGEQPPTFTDSQQVRVPCVCKTCNNGWMSRLEMKVKRYLGPMIDDMAIPLDKDYQKGLAEWAMKTAMVIDSVDVNDRYYIQSERYAFKANRTLAQVTNVVVGRFTGHSLDANANTFTILGPDDIRVASGHIFSVMVGHVVMQVKSVRIARHARNMRIKMESNPGPWAASLLQVWPNENKRVDWPPPNSFSTLNGPNNYGNLLYRWKRDSSHAIMIPKPKAV